MKELRGAILSQNHWRSQGVAEETRAPPNQNATNGKNLSKKPCFFIFRFFQHFCVQQFPRTTVINNKYY